MKPYIFEKSKIAKAQSEDRRDESERQESRYFYEVEESEVDEDED